MPTGGRTVTGQEVTFPLIEAFTRKLPAASVTAFPSRVVTKALAMGMPVSAAVTVPEKEWMFEPDPDRIAQMLKESATRVRGAVKSRVEAGRDMDLHYDHPILLLQHMLWHEGYHHGQIKLALKLTGRPLADEAAGPGTWGVWMRKT
jgi:hypothetical protein